MSADTKREPSTHADIGINPQASSTASKISIARLPILKAPGADSNYLNWRKVVQRVFKSAKVSYVLTSVAPNLRPATWDEDNDLVCAILVQIVDESNLRHLADEDNAAKIWEDLSRAHQDSSTGGRVYWIRKLVNARMEGDDIHSHIDSLAKSYERLDSLVTAEKPLTAEDVHNAALLSSIPPDWLHCVSSLMNQEGVKTETIVSALKNEAIRRESQGDIISVSSTKTSNSRPNPLSAASKGPRTDSSKKTRRCPLCNSDSHDLNSCNNTRKLIADHKAAQKARWEASQQEKPSGSNKPAARAGRTSAATLGQSSYNYEEDEQSDYSGSELKVTAGNAVAALSIPSDLPPGGDTNIDSGCSMSMTPDGSALAHLQTDHTPVRLADHSVVEATHRGLAKLPIEGSKPIKTLVVPALHEPLLSVAGLCDAGVTVVFSKSSCDFYQSNDVVIKGDVVGRGYRRGNLYYLPSEHVSSSSSLTLNPPTFDRSLLGFHNRFSHIGLKPLKLLLKTNGIFPSAMNETAVQQCPICIQAKMPRKAFKSRSSHRATFPGQLIHSDVGSYEVK
jgi:hypothetical protein